MVRGWRGDGVGMVWGEQRDGEGIADTVVDGWCKIGGHRPGASLVPTH